MGDTPVVSSSAVDPDDVARAAAAIDGHVVRTPTIHSTTLSSIAGGEVYVKLENLQFTGSFKDRGAANHLLALTDEQRANGLVALSAGNHAQGVAHMADRLGLSATIVMPETAPFTKVVNTRALGARVLQHGATLADARLELERLRSTEGLWSVPPYDDPAIIAGQGTVAVEMLADVADLDVLVVPVGGGGLVSGVATVAKGHRPDLQVIGVQVEAYGPVAARFGHHPASQPPPDTLADGIAVKHPGQLTQAIIDDRVDDVVLVSEVQIERAIALYLEIEKTVAEGAGAASLAAVLAHPERFSGRRIGLVLSGGNIDTRVLASVLMRGLVRTDRVSTLRVAIGDVPGQLAPIVAAVAEAGANVIEVDHRRLFDPISARSTNVDLVVETRDAHHRDEVIDALLALGRAVEVIG